jgi:hypothetical protein
MKFPIGLVFAVCVQHAFAQPANCPSPGGVSQAHLIGKWKAQIEGGAPFALQLVKDPEFADTVIGHAERNGERIAIAGDVDDGELTLEESRNGKNISATWLGDVVEGSCGREIRGTWKAEGTLPERPFVLKKQ